MAPSSKLLSFLLITIAILFINAEAGDVGINYGMLGNNLPTPEEVISLYKSRNVDKLRLFNPDPNALQALHGSGIEVVLGTLNQDLEVLAGDLASASNWVSTNVAPHAREVRFRYITAGNEVIPGDLAEHVLPAMQNLDAALLAANLSIPVTTVVSTEVLGVSYPPSQGAFSDIAAYTMAPIIDFLKTKQSPLLINVYPYFAYADNMKSIPLDYALFTSERIVAQDGPLGYTNLFDAIVDSMYSALERVGGINVKIVVSETGWPSNGGSAATLQNAKLYNNNLVRHVTSKQGTPKRPQIEIEAYLFAMFNENGKPAGVEQNFGLYQPDMTEVYHVEF